LTHWSGARERFSWIRVCLLVLLGATLAVRLAVALAGGA
jgi:hypothetical protein